MAHYEALSPAKRALFFKKLKQQTSGRPAAEAIARCPDHLAVPLTQTQASIWFADQIDPGSPLYNRPVFIHLKGPLKVEALEQSLNALVARHRVFSSRFDTLHGDPVQTIGPVQAISLPIVALPGGPAEERWNQARIALVEEARRPFCLSSGPLIRATLARIGEKDHLLLIATHHIVFDGWSSRILINELGRTYASLCAAAPVELPGLPIQFIDFAAWQQDQLSPQALALHLAYWKDQLADAANLNLPTDRPRPAIQGHRGAAISFSIPQTIKDKLKGLGRLCEATLFMTLLAVFKTLLHRYTFQTDISVGCPISGRTRVETEGLIGVFINTLVLRTSLANNPSFTDFLGHVRTVALDAFAHQQLPFEQLVKALNPARDSSYSPLFQVLFQLIHLSRPAPAGTDLAMEEILVDIGVAKVDLFLNIIETDQQLNCWLEYDADLFDAATIRRMAGHFQTLCEAVSDNADRPVGSLPLLTPAERQQVLVDWNATSRDYPKQQCVHHLFEAQVRRAPDQVALACGPTQLTYAELNMRANHLAHYLIGQGLGPDDIVAVYCRRSAETIVALLGILKAGGAYLPLDPDHPLPRIEFMLSDAGARLVISQPQLARTLGQIQIPVYCIDGPKQPSDAADSVDPQAPVTPAHLAYVIYTSGSTGQPKGVAVSHRSMVNHNCWFAREFNLGCRDRVLQLTSLSFDFAVEEIFPTLISGATLVLRPDTLYGPTPQFLRFIADQRISILDLPTAFWHAWVEDLPPETLHLPETLRAVIVGGEKASAESFSIWRQRVHPRLKWVNGYGPTETTVIATSWTVEPGADTLIHGDIPIGRPIANTRLYVVDPYLQPCPVGVAGELLIGGDGLARGYLNRPELTRTKFISHAFGGRPAERLYRSGDLVKYLPDGCLVFLGRQDHQVKIRGFRIEMAEIETALEQHPGVSKAFVIAAATGAGDKRLVAYYTPSGAVRPADGELAGFLSRRLPEFMIPPDYLPVEGFPLTPNGKIDRNRLPLPDGRRPAMEARLVAPRTALEKNLAQIWSELLATTPIGINDNFFSLGGHSLLATKLASRIKNQLQIELPLRLIFERPTVAGLALAVMELQASDLSSNDFNELIRQIEMLDEKEAKDHLAQSDSRKDSLPYDQT